MVGTTKSLESSTLLSLVTLMTARLYCLPPFPISRLVVVYCLWWHRAAVVKFSLWEPEFCVHSENPVKADLHLFSYKR